MTTPELIRPCPWVGPLPCEEWDAARFYGRAKELREIFPKIKTQNLTAISAESGAGKTSLINAGLVPALRNERECNPYGIGFTLCVRDWGTDALTSAASSQLKTSTRVMTEAIANSLEKLRTTAKQHANSLFGIDKLNTDLEKLPKDDLQPLTNDSAGCEQEIEYLKEYLRQLRDSVEGGKLIIIVDQAEEFMGSGIQVGPKHRHLGSLDVLEAMTQISNIRLVISLREEYLGKLRPLEERLYPLAPRVYHLDPLSWKGARESILQMANEDTDVEIDETVINQLFDYLSLTPYENESQRDLLPVDMLAVQALLYDLYKRGSGLDKDRCSSSTPSRRLRIDELYITKYISDLKWNEPQLIDEKAESDKEKQKIEIHSLLSVGPMLRWIDRAFDILDPEKQNLAKRVVANMGTILSTPKGFKTHITGGDLVYHAIRKDLPISEKTNLKNVHNALKNNNKLKEPDFKPLAVKISEAGFDAIDCLTKGNILKRYGADKNSSAIYSLQHDGYAPAMTEWCEDPRRRENDCLTPRIGVYGVQILRTKALENVELHEVRWEGCAVHNINVTKVEFKNCKFTGSFFEECTFTQCTFDDCELDGAVFLGCKFNEVDFIHCMARGMVAKSLKSKETMDIILPMVLQKVEFKDCNLSSTVFQGISLKESLGFEECLALYAQLYKFDFLKATNGEDPKITAKGCNLHGSLFQDFEKVHSDNCFNISADITNAPSAS